MVYGPHENSPLPRRASHLSICAPFFSPPLGEGGSSELSLLEWQQSDVVRRLSQLIANAAIEDVNAIPEQLLAAYHDALQLHVLMKQLSKQSADSRMQEVMQ